ncbi:MAG: hypothetical protein GTO45_16510 [Candidatus Aminicenantes bacterium]|nr:hypothetical protein [Candidatus Aminicenantes bacterium]NIM78304.1 hypothetical protein [Candidatus Aminicenantes bacterium]NIN19730.1 hypothetical protein [Candidatus Aminicenantes bacterium]NIN43612.1 hypothetical protein [Candidatus Aminicenantes bacterium]NIN86357.1 hypothetical protein [Candidatus Aminicenantes bacterium]
MKGRIFLHDDGNVYVRNYPGQEVSFNSVDDFYKYYPGSIDLSGKYYINYEPDRYVFYYRDDPEDFSPLVNQYEAPLPEYEAIIANVSEMIDKRNDPYFGMEVDEARAYKLNEIKRLTYSTITRHLPEWKQLKWNEYIRVYEKIMASHSLTPLEQDLYDGFPDEGETHESCYEKVLKAVSWIIRCAAANDAKEEELANTANLQDIRNIGTPDYPGFPL